MTASLKQQLSSSLGATALKLQKRLDAADAAGGKVPSKKSPKATDRWGISLLPAEKALVPKIQAKAAREGRIVQASEIARAGLLLLSMLDGAELAAAIDKVQRVKPGRKPENG